MRSTRKPIAVRAAFGLIACGIAVATLNAAVPFGATAAAFVENVVYHAVLATAVVLCAARAIAVRPRGAAYWALAAGLAAWTVGDLYWTIALSGDPAAPYPSWADACYLLLYPALCVAAVLLLRERGVRLGALFGIDGVIAGLGIGAVCAAVVGEAILSRGDADLAAALTNVAYPIGDLLALSSLLGAAALTGWRLDGTLVRLAAGFGVFAVADSLYLFQVVDSSYVAGGLVDIGWLVAGTCFALAAWHEDRGGDVEGPATTWRLLLTPAAFAALSLGILVYGYFEPLNAFAVGLAALSLGCVIVRMVLTFRENLTVLAASRRDALSDALTGLGNRRRLIQELDRWLAAGDDAAPGVLVLFDLNGFKHFNDSFGHPAGDALLARLGARLAGFAANRGGSAYRLGGDEFCVVVPIGDKPIDAFAGAAAGVFHERGEGFAINAAYGWVALPAEARTADVAMGAADRRMYAMKDATRRVPGRETGDALLQLMVEQDPELGAHVTDVADLARATAERLGLAPDDVERVVLAAELHDVGKSAIPDAILGKPGPLDDAEWQVMRRHTLIGERILASSPTLSTVAPLVRSSHERYDGGGYPDGLAADAIPLGARIVFACDAFDAMVSERPYQPTRSVAAAVAELRSCAGLQFDPQVAAALCAVIADRGLVPPTALAVPAGR
jgi:diguanylate cyclase (GGDEF)-like protein